MNVDEILNKLDSAFNDNNLYEADNILTLGIREAGESGDSASLLQLLNEYIGLLRVMGRFDEAYEIGNKIRILLDNMGLNGSIPYATSLLNVATALRAGGRFEESLSVYNEVEAVYVTSLPANSMLLAGFYNNKSLLFQENGNLEASIECLEKAYAIASSNGEDFEAAVSSANLANSYIGLHNYASAYTSASRSKALFEKAGTRDTHYCSALYVLGICEKENGNIDKAREYLNEALNIMEHNLGKNEFYYRIHDELDRCSDTNSFISGMDLSKAYYEEVVKPLIEAEFPSYVNKIAVGLVGRGSDCYMFDDEHSMDHDWGPEVCIWVSAETYNEIGEALTNLYTSLPADYKGIKRGPVVSSHKRRGVFIIEDFYRQLLGVWPIEAYEDIPDHSLAECVNGQVFTDPEGIFTSIRNRLTEGFPEYLKYRKIADAASKFSQAAQYNLPRFLTRNDTVTASIMLATGIKEAMRLAHYLDNKYPPHDKWLYRSLNTLSFGEDIIPMINMAMETGDVSALSEFLARLMYTGNYISDIDDYLDHHADELLIKSTLASLNNNELVKKIVELEFEAFDKVDNEGGRADCQDDWLTFSKMRKSQYLTWTKPMLMQYYYDFLREYRIGHNLITEKYGRMMASTAPIEYARIKDNFPPIPEEKAAIIEAIVSIQVNWMEDFSAEYPKLAGRARSIHSFEDTPYNTSYETYLRGEIQTYSDKMLQLYGMFISSKLEDGSNLAYEIMMHNCALYGYKSLKAAEEKA